MRSAAGVLAAVAVLALVSTTLASLVPIYDAAIQDGGLRRSLTDADPGDRLVSASLRGEAADWPEVAAGAARAGSATLGDAAATVVFGLGPAYRVGEPNGGDGDDRDSTNVAVLDDWSMFTVVDGELGGGGVAVHVDAADRIGVQVGESIVLDRPGDRRDVVVDALVEPSDPADVRWAGEPFGRQGVVPAGSTVEVGPLWVDESTFAALGGSVSYRVLLVPQIDELDRNDVAAALVALDGVDRALADAVGIGQIEVADRFSPILSEVDTTLRSSGIVVGSVLVQIAAIALYGVGVAAVVLALTRRAETSLLSSRGIRPRQLVVASGVEALLVALPAVVLGPWLAARAVDLVAMTPPIEQSGLDLRGTVTATAVIASVVAGLIVVVVATVAGASAIRAQIREQRDDDRRSWITRSGLDLVLFVLAVVGLVYIARTAGTERVDATGDLAFDPLLALAPALAVAAAALLAMRLGDLTARWLSVPARRGGVAAALAAWTAVRRPAARRRSAALVVIAVAVAVFAAVHSLSWEASQRDQASGRVGADLLVEPASTSADGVVAARGAAGYREFAGVGAVMPVEVRRADVGAAARTVSLVATDATQLPAVGELRADAGPDPTQLPALVDPVDLGGIELPAGELSVDVRVAVEAGGQPADPAGAGPLRLQLHIADEFGIVTPIIVRDVVADGEVRTVDLGDIAAAERGTSRLVGIDLVGPVREWPLATSPADAEPEWVFDVELDNVRVDGEPVDVLSDLEWRARPIERSRTTRDSASLRSTARDADAALHVQFATGRGWNPRDEVAAELTSAPIRANAARQELPALAGIVTPEVLAENSVAVGDTISVRAGVLRFDLDIVGVAEHVPFAVDEVSAILVDAESLTTREYLATGRTSPERRWAIDTTETDADAVQAALSASTLAPVAVENRFAAAQALASDPALVGLAGSLLVAVIASAVVAIVGLGLTSITEARRRRSSYAVLRSLGSTRRELRSWLLRETMPVAIVAVALGVAAGLTLAWLSLDAFARDRDGSAAIPQPQLLVPWLLVVGVAVLGVAIVALVPLSTSRLLAHTRVADQLRIGERP